LAIAVDVAELAIAPRPLGKINPTPRFEESVQNVRDPPFEFFPKRVVHHFTLLGLLVGFRHRYLPTPCPSSVVHLPGFGSIRGVPSPRHLERQLEHSTNATDVLAVQPASPVEIPLDRAGVEWWVALFRDRVSRQSERFRPSCDRFLNPIRHAMPRYRDSCKRGREMSYLSRLPAATGLLIARRPPGDIGFRQAFLPRLPNRSLLVCVHLAECVFTQTFVDLV